MVNSRINIHNIEIETSQSHAGDSSASLGTTYAKATTRMNNQIKLGKIGRRLDAPAGQVVGVARDRVISGWIGQGFSAEAIKHALGVGLTNILTPPTGRASTPDTIKGDLCLL